MPRLMDACEIFILWFFAEINKLKPLWSLVTRARHRPDYLSRISATVGLFRSIELGHSNRNYPFGNGMTVHGGAGWKCGC